MQVLYKLNLFGTCIRSKQLYKLNLYRKNSQNLYKFSHCSATHRNLMCRSNSLELNLPAILVGAGENMNENRDASMDAVNCMDSLIRNKCSSIDSFPTADNGQKLLNRPAILKRITPLTYNFSQLTNTYSQDWTVRGSQEIDSQKSNGSSRSELGKYVKKSNKMIQIPPLVMKNKAGSSQRIEISNLNR